MQTNKDKKYERNYFIDILKGLTIFLVIFGHTIQYYEVNYGLEFFSDSVYKYIYSFHMPMFIFLSGYLFYLTIKKYDSMTMLIRKIKQLLIPLISWCSIGLIFTIISLKGLTDLSVYIQVLTNLIFIGFWFIWILLLCYITVVIVNRVFKDNLYIYLLIILIMFFIPDGNFFFYYKYMFPYFLLGYSYNKYKLNILSKINAFGFLGILLLYGTMLYFFKDNYYIYISKMTIDSVSQLWIILYRYIIGILGIAFISIAVKYLMNFVNKYSSFIFKVLSYIGQYTLGLYFLSSLLFIYVFKYIIFFRIDGILMYALLIIMAIIIILFCLLVFRIIKLNKTTSKLFLGDK